MACLGAARRLILSLITQEIKKDVAESCQLVMVFIPKSTELYNAVKIRLCQDMPTPSQCICVGKNLKDSRKVAGGQRWTGVNGQGEGGA